MIQKFIHNIKYILRNKNKFAGCISHQNNIHIDKFTYGSPQIYMWTNKYHVYIGKFCSIGDNVRIIVDGNHRTDWISTYPFGELIDDFPKNSGHPIGKGDTQIGNDVWIGRDVLILPGIIIGDGAVIGAGSVVTKNINHYEIVGGNPAKHIRHRFSEVQIKSLRIIQWWNWPIEQIIASAHLLQSPNIDEFINKHS